MSEETTKTYYFLGIGGIGMSALARYFKKQGCDVSGYDKTPSRLTQQLIDEDIAVHFEEDISKVPADPDLVVYTPAIPQEHAEYQFILKNNIPLKKRAEILGELSRNKISVAIAGTHGKTTITGMVAHTLKLAGVPVNAFVGGIIKNYQSNLITSENAGVVVTEADEYDRSFLWLDPDIAVISAMDADHLDIYSNTQNLIASFHAFAKKIKSGGNLIMKKGLPDPEINDIHTFHYDKADAADFYAKDVEIKNGKYHVTLCLQDAEIRLVLNIPGRHNIENAVAAAAVCSLYGLKTEEIKSGLETYEGICRRFDVRYQQGNITYIDDYAHHPEELRAFIGAVRELYPGKKISGIFQPHLYSRTLHFAAAFAEVLDHLDEALLLDIYPARELPVEGVTSCIILEKMKIAEKKIVSKESLLPELRNHKTEVLLTMGAGDIDQLIDPIINVLKEKIR
ncbi:MAG TPA: UDP-N-acetylmuramate--L-alanine ligase [Bacteroidales bacterium]|nr:UDP-N-acetylmuramate--L-alanine ligase [Bacteroidales bacterium]